MMKTYKTQGAIATIKWRKNNSAEAGKSADGVLAFTIDPVAPYRFDETEGDKTKKFVLLEDITDRQIVKKQEAAKTDFTPDFGNPTMSFAALLLLKQNRTKVEIETSSESSPFLLTRIEIK